MNDDRELLEDAAKAVGLTLPHHVPYGVDDWVREWNPLTDDGDAFRLAVALRLDITFKAFGADEVMVSDSEDRFPGWFSDPYDSDPCAATRRAIVRAAAALKDTA